MFRKILLPLDGTDLSSRAIQSALNSAKAARGEIVAVCIVPTPTDAGEIWDAPGDKTSYAGKEHDIAADLTESVVESARRVGVYCRAVETRSASPVQAIVDTAKSYCCDVIYMMPHASSGRPGTSFSDSLAYQVLEKSTVPVLVFR